MSFRQISTRLLHSRRYYCDKLWAACSIRWNGDLEPCPCVCGNTPVFPIPDIPFMDAWNSAPYQQTRAYLLRQLGRTNVQEASADQAFDICRNCSVPLVDRHSIIRWRLRGMGLALRLQAQRAKSAESRQTLDRKFENYRNLLKYLENPQSSVPHYPILGNIDASNLCNLRCPMCKVGTREIDHPRGMMDLGLYSRILEEIGEGLIRLELYRYGEPMLNPDIAALVELASQKYQIRTTISSNLSMPLPARTLEAVVRAGLDTLVVAADGIEQSMYEKYRQGGNLAQVIDNLKNLIAIKQSCRAQTPKIIWQYLVFSHNESAVNKARELALRLGVNRFVAIEPAVPKYDKFAAWISRKQGYRGLKDETLHQQVLHATIEPGGPIQRNSKFEIAVRIRNTTDEVWPKDNAQSTPVRLGIKLYRSEEFLHELGRGMLESNLEPGEERILHLELAAPEIPGNYRLKLDMLREDAYWFEWKTGHRSKPLWIDLPII